MGKSQDVDEHTEKIRQSNFKLYSYRWVVLFFFSGCLFNFSLIGLSFSPIAIDVSNAFEVDIFWVNLCSCAAQFFYIPFTFISYFMYRQMKLHHVLIIGALM